MDSAPEEAAWYAASISLTCSNKARSLGLDMAFLGQFLERWEGLLHFQQFLLDPVFELGCWFEEGCAGVEGVVVVGLEQLEEEFQKANGIKVLF